MTQTTAAPRMNLAGRRSPYIFEDWDARIFRVNREVFRSDEIFARERRLWDRLWLYLGHETEVPKPGDFKIRTLAGRPLIFTRDSKGQVRAYLNACPHRGTILCRETEGNAKTYQCFYHAWTFANTGELVGIPDPGAYPPERGFAATMGLRGLPRVENHRGFVFVSFALDGANYEIDLNTKHAEKLRGSLSLCQ